MSERLYYAKVNQRISKSLDAGLRREAEESNEDLADVVRDCLYRGLALRQKEARKRSKRETPLTAA